MAIPAEMDSEPADDVREASEQVNTCQESLRAITDEIGALAEKEIRLMEALEEIRQRREMKLREQANIEQELRHQAGILKGLKQQEHTRVLNLAIEQREGRNACISEMYRLE